MTINKFGKVAAAMLFGVAIGDALGVPVEFSWRHDLKSNPVVGMRSGGSWEQPAGTWSDDTSMTLATMDSIAQCKSIQYDDIMTRFILWYQSDMYTCDKLFDIGNTTSTALNRYLQGSASVESGLKGYKSNGNGSLMRIAPIGLYIFSKYGHKVNPEAMDIVHKVSALTHANPISQMCCGAYCMIMMELLAGKSISQAVKDGLKQAQEYYEVQPKFAGLWDKHLNRLSKENFKDTPEGNIISSGYVVASFEAAIWCLLNSSDYSTAVLTAVNLGRDTDTIAAITGGLAGVAYGVDSIPSKWVNEIRRRDYLLNIALNFSNAL